MSIGAIARSSRLFALDQVWIKFVLCVFVFLWGGSGVEGEIQTDKHTHTQKENGVSCSIVESNRDGKNV